MNSLLDLKAIDSATFDLYKKSSAWPGLGAAVSDANHDYFDANQAALDRPQLAKLKADLETMMVRHGRGRIHAIFLDALRDSEREGAKWEP